MSAEYSVEEVREFARSVATYGNAKHTAMLIDLIERIEADERTADYPECSGDPASCPENEGFGCCKANSPAQAAQVAQLWEMKQRACLAHALCNELRLAHPEIPELGDDGVLHEAIHDILRVDTPTAEPVAHVQFPNGMFDGPLPDTAKPHSPDAADSGRVDEILAHLKDPANVHVMMLRGVIAVPSIRSMVARAERLAP